MLVWVIAGVATILFLYLRANTYTVEDARPSPDQLPGFGPQISLRQAARGYFSHLISWMLLIAWTMTLGFRIYVGQWSVYDLAVVAVILISWPLQEWFIHAQLEHFKPFSLWLLVHFRLGDRPQGRASDRKEIEQPHSVEGLFS